MTATLLAALGAYAALVLPAGALLALAWHGVPSLRRGGPLPLLALRLAPSMLALAGAIVVGAAFGLNEPAEDVERHPTALFVVAGVGLALLVAGARRALHAQRGTAQVVTGWERTSERLSTRSPLPCYRVDDAAPQACVAGVRQPRLFVTSGLLDAVSADELELVLRHEEAHVRRADNVARWLLRAAPDALAGTRAAQEIEASWAAAAETRADRDAVAGDRDRALQLAATLVRLGRAHVRATPALTASALTPGAVLEHRVRHLVSPRPAVPTATWVVGLAALAACALALLAARDLQALHGVLESLVAVR